MTISYDEIMVRMIRMARPVAHHHIESCQADMHDEHGHTLQCQSLTGSFAALMAAMYYEGRGEQIRHY